MAITASGPSTPETPYLVPTATDVGVISLISAGDEVAVRLSPWARR